MMTRLRQLCDHPGLIPDNFMDTLGGGIVNPEDIERLVEVLRVAVDEREECVICFDTFTYPVITRCAHYFCRECIVTVINGDNSSCPMCRRKPLTEASLIMLPPEDQEEEIVETNSTQISSSKIDALVKILQATAEGKKTVVFSQWTSMLAKVKTVLNLNGMNCTQFNGKLNAQHRERNLQSIS